MALAWRKDVWSIISSFMPWRRQGRTLGAILADSEGQRWLVFVVHFPSEPAEQQKLWTCLRQERQRFSELRVVIFGDVNSIVHPPWDNTSVFESGVSVAESVNMQKAREIEVASMLTMGPQDARRRVHPDPKLSEEVGATRGDRHIDRV